MHMLLLMVDDPWVPGKDDTLDEVSRVINLC